MKRNGIYLSVIFILLIVIGIEGFSYYNYVKKVEQNNINSTESNKEDDNTKKNNDFKLSDEEIKYYLDIVPLSIFVNDNNEVDSYTGSKVTIENISKHVLYARAFKDMKPSNNDTYLDCDSYGKAEDFKTNLKNYYNISNPIFENNVGYEPVEKEEYRFDYIGTTVIEYDSKLYLCQTSGADNIDSKVNKLIDYKVLDGDLIITEKAGFIYEYNYEDDFATVLLSTSSPDSKVTTLDNKEKVQEYFNNNLDKFETFKHTYKKNGDKYYYYSTELS